MDANATDNAPTSGPWSIIGRSSARCSTCSNRSSMVDRIGFSARPVPSSVSVSSGSPA